MTEEMKVWAAVHENDMKKIYGKTPVTCMEYKHLMLELIRNGFTEWSTELRKRYTDRFDNYEEFLTEPNPMPYMKWSDWKARYPHYYQKIKGELPTTRLEYYDILKHLTNHGFYCQIEQLDKQHRLWPSIDQ